MPAYLPMLLTFLAALLAVPGVYAVLADVWQRKWSRTSVRVDEEFHPKRRELPRKWGMFKDVGRLAPHLKGEEGGEKLGWRDRLELLIEQAHLRITARTLLAGMSGLGLVLGMLATLLWRTPLAGAGAALVGVTLPYLYVCQRRKFRLGRLEAQLPDAFDTLARALRAGHSLPRAFQTVAVELSAPVADEFALCHEQQHLGLPMEGALRDLARRTNLPDLKIFVMAVLIQQQCGGNLAELLDKFAAVVRERFRMRARIRTLTAEGMMQAGVLMAMPPALFVALLILKRSYAMLLLGNPGLLVGTVVLQLLGALWIRGIIKVVG